MRSSTMKFWMMILASLGTCAVGGDIDCGSGEARYRLAWQEALTALENRAAFRAELVLQVFDQSGRVDLGC